jgi:glutaredoxin
MLTMRGAILAVLAAASSTAAAQIYRWTDENGKLHVTDTPPPVGAKNVQQRQAPTGAQPQESEPYVLQEVRKKAPVTLYSTPRCELCDRARGLLNARGVPFKEISVVSETQLAELKKVVGGDAVPSMVVGSSVQRGFEETIYHGILDAAGYPKSGVLPPRSQKEPKFEAPGERKAQAAEEAPRGPYAPRVRTLAE